MKNRKAFTPASVKPTESNSRVIVKVKGDESVDTLLEFINGNEEKKTKVKSNFETKLKNKKGKTRAKKV